MDKSLKLGYHPIHKHYGYYIDKVPQNVLDEVKIQIDELQFDFSKGIKMNEDLAGEIEQEYKISPQSQTKKYIQDLCQQFENESQYVNNNIDLLPTLKFSEFWVNFQKKYEYNPIHNHGGVFSFVIFYQIPFIFKNEYKYHYSPKHCFHGQFNFITPSPSNQKESVNILPLNIDKSKEGYIAIFPSSLNHIVYPFYSSDEYRITIAGNIKIK
tara:strand:+ start:60 stop:695 length:636 start_codon:yes stop_codon:yes gene_type:complete